MVASGKQGRVEQASGVGEPDAVQSRGAPGLHRVSGDNLLIASGSESLLGRSYTQWQFGDWSSLAALSGDVLHHHPDRAELALLAIAGHLALGNQAEVREYTRLAMEWGCTKTLVSQILIAGVYNTLGRAAAISGEDEHALGHFENAIKVGSPGSDAQLLARARAGEQLIQLGMSELAGVAAPNSPAMTDPVLVRIKAEIRAEVNADLKASIPNPYVHNRTLTPALNKSLREFAEGALNCEGLKPAYIDYLAAKSIQIERNCVGRLATTVQDAIARQLVAECVPGENIGILEIGALYGISLAILYNHAVTRFSSAKVVCLDPFDGYYGKALDAVLNQPVNDLTFIRNMRLANVPQSDFALIKHYSTDPAALSAAMETAFNLLVIDGDHSYEGVKYDFETYFPLLQPGGYVIFDDYNAKEWPGVQRFIDEDLNKTPEFEYLGAISRTAVGRKRMGAQQ